MIYSKEFSIITVIPGVQKATYTDSNEIQINPLMNLSRNLVRAYSVARAAAPHLT